MPVITGFSVPVESAIIRGGVVGAFKVPGSLQPGDRLLAVIRVSDGPPTHVADLTGEFSITAGQSGTITNTTTNTTGAFLLVAWAKAA
jgi:hypothetical protein